MTAQDPNAPIDPSAVRAAFVKMSQRLAGLETGIQELKQLMQARNAPPPARQAPPPNRSQGGGGGYGGQGRSQGGGGQGGGYGRPRGNGGRQQAPFNAPWLDEHEFDGRVLDEALGFGKHRGRTWAELLTGDDRQYIEFLARTTVEKAGLDISRWGAQEDVGRVCCWLLHHGDKYLAAADAAPAQAGPVDDGVPF